MPSLLVASFLSIGISSQAHAERADQSIHIEINGQEKVFNQQPVIYNDITLVPMRAIFEELGAEVKWDNSTRKITATKENTTIELKIDSKDAFKNYDIVRLLQAPSIINNNTMVPLRFVSEAMGAEVKWDEKSKTISINSTQTKTQTQVQNQQSSTDINKKIPNSNTTVATLTYKEALDSALNRNSQVGSAEAKVDRSWEVFDKSMDNIDYIPSGTASGSAAAIARNAFAGYQSASIGYQMSQKQLDIAKESVTYAVKKAYNDILRAQEQKDIATAALEYAENEKKVAYLKETQGLVSSYDFNTIENKVKESKNNLKAAEEALNNAYEKLNLLTGFQNNKRYHLTDIPSIENFEYEDVETQVARVLKDSSAVWLADQQINLAKLNVDLYTFNDPTNPDSYEAKQIDVKIKDYEKANTKQQLEQTTRSLFNNITQLEVNYEKLTTQLSHAEETLKLAKTKYDTGMGVAIDLKGAQLQVDQIKQQMFDIVAQLDYLKMAYEKPWVAGGM